ncbi:MAG: synthase subunit [Actinomycetota bacterium]|jgi:F-type H+-transporting ATPase subunit b
MSVLGIIAVAGRVASETVTTDGDGHVTTNNPFIPGFTEVAWGGIASVLVIGLLVWKAGPAVKQFFADRTAKIQKELDDAAADKVAAASEAEGIRHAKGDIESERARILAEAKAQAEVILTDGRARLVTEVAELEARSAADIVAARGRVGDELRAEISRLSSAAVDHVVSGSLDDATHQELIENFISRVGAQS